MYEKISIQRPFFYKRTQHFHYLMGKGGSIKTIFQSPLSSLLFKFKAWILFILINIRPYSNFSSTYSLVSWIKMQRVKSIYIYLRKYFGYKRYYVLRLLRYIDILTTFYFCLYHKIAKVFEHCKKIYCGLGIQKISHFFALTLFFSLFNFTWKRVK